jgi:hypothetical protein
LHYAIFDKKDAIGREHLDAALAVWDYCAASVAYVFGDPLANPEAARIFPALPDDPADGLDGTQLRDLFHRHANKEDIASGVRFLTAYGLAVVRTEQTGGRPRTIVSRATKAIKATKAADPDAPVDLLSLRSLLSHQAESPEEGTGDSGGYVATAADTAGLAARQGRDVEDV